MGVDVLHLVARMLTWSLLQLQRIIVIIVVLPLSFICDQFLSVRKRLVFAIGTARKAHGRKVAAIQRQVRKWAGSGKETKMYPVESGRHRSHPLPQKGITPIYVGNLMDILEVNKDALSVRVEPMVTMEDLSRTLIPLGYCLPLLPPLKHLTVQDVINGGGVGTSGRKYGLFQHICLSYELVMPDGSLVVASKEKKDDAETQALFYGVPWSHGALGILVAVTLRMIAVKPFVRLTYIPTNSFDETKSKLTEGCQCRENEFVEGLQFSKSKGVVLHGRFCDGPPKNQEFSLNEFGLWYKPWFYIHVQKIASLNKERVEYVPLYDFYNRHSRSLFWEIKDLIPFSSYSAFRWIFAWMLPPRIELFETLAPSTMKSWLRLSHVRHDFLVPLEQLTEVMTVCDKEFQVYPLWLCPYNQPSCPGLLRQRSGRNMLFINVGVYGSARRDEFDAKKSIKRLEEFAISVKGVQMMVHGEMRMSRAEFWEMFDSSLYEWLRVKYNCKEAFFDVYDKIYLAVK